MLKYLEGTGKTTLLKIDFNLNPEEEIKKLLDSKTVKLKT